MNTRTYYQIKGVTSSCLLFLKIWNEYDKTIKKYPEKADEKGENSMIVRSEVAES